MKEEEMFKAFIANPLIVEKGYLSIEDISVVKLRGEALSDNKMIKIIRKVVEDIHKPNFEEAATIAFISRTLNPDI